MNSIFNRTITILSIIGIGCISILLITYLVGIRINATKSIPLGVYWITNKLPETGNYIMLCPPDNETFTTAKKRGYIVNGFCPGNYGALMKKVFAIHGDQITIDENGIVVNEQLIPLSKPYKTDPAGRPLTIHHITNYKLDQDELLLLSDTTSTSFDSRYFGPVNKSHITAVIQPIWIW